jgi:hypothetical protein
MEGKQNHSMKFMSTLANYAEEGAWLDQVRSPCFCRWNKQDPLKRFPISAAAKIIPQLACFIQEENRAKPQFPYF